MLCTNFQRLPTHDTSAANLHNGIYKDGHYKQCSVIGFPVAVTEKVVNIHKWLSKVYGNDAVNRSIVHSIQQKSIGLKFSKSRTGSHVTYTCHHNSSRFTFPIFVHSWHFCLPFITINHTAYILVVYDMYVLAHPLAHHLLVHNLAIIPMVHTPTITNGELTQSPFSHYTHGTHTNHYKRGSDPVTI